MKKILYISLSLAAGLISRAAIYDVGPASALTKLSEVAWGALKPGDIVNIYPTPGGYHEIIQVSAAGTAAQPIIIRGIPDPVTGALPVIDGKNAVMDPRVDFRSTGTNRAGLPISDFEQWGVLLVTPRKTGYVYGTTFPEYITIESLNIQGALYDPTGAISFTDQRGAKRIYDPFACGIYIEFARHLTIRGCEISFNGNGIFANSKNGAAQSSVDLLIEKNYIHDNGQPIINNQTASNGLVYWSNGYHEHNIYVESVGAVYQYNRFGPLRPGCFGTMIKDRSSGTLIRYNEVTSTAASNIFAILDPQGGTGYIDVQPNYRDVFVYGNVITLQPSAVGCTALIWFGAFNGAAYYSQLHRGVLHFYQNTVVSHQGTIGAFDLTSPEYSGGPSILESVDCRNNIFYTDSSFQSFYSAFHFVVGGGVTAVNLGVNWVSPGSRPDWGGHPFAGTVNGMSNLIVGNAAGQNDPGFVDLTGGDYHLTSAADSIDTAGLLDTATLNGGYTPTDQYVAPQTHAPRTTLGAAADLGAFESAAVYSGNPPPPVTPPPVTPPPPPVTNPPPTSPPPTSSELLIALPRSYALTLGHSEAITLTAAVAMGSSGPLVYELLTKPVRGTLTGTPPNLVYTPAAAEGGSDYFSFVVHRGTAVSAPAFIFLGYNLPNTSLPSITLTSPAAVTATKAPASIQISATASDPSGIKKVDFFVGGTLIGTATAAPYKFTWTQVPTGTYSVVAKVFNNLNIRTYSKPAVVMVRSF